MEESIPLPEDVTYLPERPIIGMSSSLSDQITYPVELPQGLNYEELRQWLRYVGLEHLLEGGAMDAVADWSSILTLREQQALGLARLLYHRPRFAVLDESTSAMSVQEERQMLRAVRELGVSCITMVQQSSPALEDEHLRLLRLQSARGEDTRGWKLVNCSSTKEGIVDMPRPLCKSAAEAHQRLQAIVAAKPIRGPEHEAELAMRSMPTPAKSSFCRQPSPSDSVMSAEAVQRRWPHSLARIRAVLQLGMLTSSRRRMILQKVALMLLLLQVRTRLYWQFCRGLAGMGKALLLRDFSLAAAELVAGAAVVLAGAFSDQLLRHLFSNSAIELWTGAMGYLQRKLFRDVALLHVGDSVEEPMQRLVEARGLFDSLMSLFHDVLVPMANLAYLMPALVRNLGAMPVFVIGGQVALLRGLQALLGPDSDATQAAQLESRFQAMHGRLRSSAEDTAFCGGGALQRQAIVPQFEASIEEGLSARTRELFSRAASTFASDWKQLPSWIVRILSARLDQSSLVDALCSTFLFDRISQAVQVSVQSLAKSVEKAGRLDGQCSRFLELQVAVEDACRTPLVAPLPQAKDAVPQLGLSGHDLVSKEGVLLSQGLTFEVRPGEPLLVTGPAGSGKSALVALLLGLSPAQSRDLPVPRPPRGTVMAATQQPYLPAGCRLVAQLAYPSVLRLPSRPPFVVRLPEVAEALSEAALREHFASLGAVSCQTFQVQGSRKGVVGFKTFEDTIRAVARPQDRIVAGHEVELEIGDFSENGDESPVAGGVGPPPIGECLPRLRRMRRCLRTVGLDHLLTREQDGWLARRVWQDVLSLEEQQRLCLARILYHQPSFCLLDDATSAIPAAVESKLHQSLKDWDVTPIALSRRARLGEVYGRELQLAEGGACEWKLQADADA